MNPTEQITVKLPAGLWDSLATFVASTGRGDDPSRLLPQDVKMAVDAINAALGHEESAS